MNKIVLIDTDGVEYVFSYPGLSLKDVIREFDEVVRWISSSNVHTRVVMAQGRDIPNEFLHIKSDDNALLIKVEKIDKIIIRQEEKDDLP